MRIWSTRNSHTLLVKMQNGTATWKKVFKFFIKLNVCLLHDPGIYLWSLYNNKNLHSYKNLYVNIYSSSIHNWQKTGNNSNVLQQVNGREKIRKKKKKRNIILCHQKWEDTWSMGFSWESASFGPWDTWNQ